LFSNGCLSVAFRDGFTSLDDLMRFLANEAAAGRYRTFEQEPDAALYRGSEFKGFIHTLDKAIVSGGSKTFAWDSRRAGIRMGRLLLDSINNGTCPLDPQTAFSAWNWVDQKARAT